VGVLVERLSRDRVQAALDDVARLRIEVFRAYPYLYDGDIAYERRYLAPYRDDPDAVLVAAWDGDRLVGCATGTPMEAHAEEFQAPFAAHGFDLAEMFYCAESVLLPEYRGQGIGHRFFDLREEAARALGRRWSCFCAVVRPGPAPADYRPLDAFWRKRGYAPAEGLVAHFKWKDVGDAAATEKPLQFWLKDLERPEA